MLPKETIIEQAKIIILQKKPNLNVEKFMKLDFSLLCWQTVVIKLTIHQFEDGLRQYIGSYITLVEGKAKLQRIQIENQQLIQELELLTDQPFYYGLDYLANDKEFYQILALSHCTLTIIKDVRIQQIIKNYYSLCEYQVLESLSKVYFLQQEPSVLISMLIHESSRIKLQKAQSVYKIGDSVKGFYLVLEGEICIKKLVELQTQSQDDISNTKKSRKKLVIQNILSKDQQFGEMELFTRVTHRNELAECYSLECDLLFVPTHSLVEAYQTKLQDPHFSLEKLFEQFQEYITLKNSKQSEAITKYIQVNKPRAPPKPEMKPTYPLFMNLQPIQNFKNPAEKAQPSLQIIRTSSMYTQSQTQLKKVNKQPESVFVNYSLAKLNRQDGLMTVSQYIENIKLQQSGKSGISAYQQKKKLKQNALSVVTEDQQKLIDYVRQLTPLYISKKRNSVGLRKSLPTSIYQSAGKSSYMMLKPDFSKM
ncbi:unnamed protein product (macronuclear) [Paramecium tetraurelia]|uniref:Cyclic nucleotide-binding domain-containing protein n=1 Tax=Paramecium tetraurelia TaxID=5888 RepID=A0BIA4_PARTE|nr:uncharacterized protein GSPATT00004643001 [Paramecium tetraurelia]CAK58271.1 unnamed protein product [Paramecium tetraurelia]|eukprot:XP_001425669.1 hypothetical protein (macronuclear) [Paramecium tetraurelia strain d4-2]